eukprot:546263-Rhodomonas_salina.8
MCSGAARPARLGAGGSGWKSADENPAGTLPSLSRTAIGYGDGECSTRRRSSMRMRCAVPRQGVRMQIAVLREGMLRPGEDAPPATAPPRPAQVVSGTTCTTGAGCTSGARDRSPTMPDTVFRGVPETVLQAVSETVFQVECRARFVGSKAHLRTGSCVRCKDSELRQHPCIVLAQWDAMSLGIARRRSHAIIADTLSSQTRCHRRHAVIADTQSRHRLGFSAKNSADLADALTSDSGLRVS